MLLQGKRCCLCHSLARRDALLAKALLFQKSLGMHIGAERGWKWEEGVGVGGGGEGMGALGDALRAKASPARTQPNVFGVPASSRSSATGM